ncbi:fibronectin type III domain-containing protein [Actinoplanes sp. NPDC051513]|uniref:fibronectin type III domain-containing protein n=1 Tax=Actinoplanes sp. NPDC051513 TaxID=3363908 RepID=UPI0037889ED7
MVRSIQRRRSAALLAVIVVGLLGVVAPDPAEADGGLTGAAAYYIDANAGEAVRIAQDGTHEILGNNFGGSPGIAVGDDGTVYVARSYDGEVFKIEADQAPAPMSFTTVFPVAIDLVVDHADTLYLATPDDGVVKRLADGTESTLTSNDILQYSSVAVSQDGTVYVLDRASGAVNKMDPSGTSSTVVVGYPEVDSISVLAIDGQDRLYVGAGSTGTVYRVTQGGGPPTVDTLTTTLGNFTDLDVTPDGTVYASQQYPSPSNLVRMDSDGNQVTVDGNIYARGLKVVVLPDPPATVTAVAGNTSAEVSWDTAGTNGGDSIKRYTAVADPGGATCVPVVHSDMSCTFTGLANDTEYTFKVKASNTDNDRGESLLSDASNAVTPGTPASPSPSPSSSSPPPSSSPSPSPSLTTSPTTTSPTTTSPTTTPTPTPSASPTPTTTPSTSPTPRPTKPLAPTGLTAVAGTSSIQISWQPPADNGVAVTGYRAIADPGPAVCTTTGATSCVLGGTAGVSYRVRVVAMSAGGVSALSGYSAAVVPTAPPVAGTPPATSVPLETDQGQISNAAPGQQLVLVGTGYAPYSTVTLTLYSDPIVLGQVRADADGAFRKAVTVPADLAAGKHSFAATGVDPSGKSRAMRLDVAVRPEPGKLPVTGPAVIWMIVTGLGITAIGAGLRIVRP